MRCNNLTMTDARNEGLSHPIPWAKTLIDQLVKQGVNYFCISPGSRSSALTLACSENTECSSISHFDERGLAFHALGYAKATHKACCIIVTSGTAVANLLPSLIEAHNERIPLIVLTADRPPELRDCGANQSCDQVNIFANYTRFQVDFPCPSAEIPERYIATTVATAVHHAHGNPKGPVHINCMFREPLFSTQFQEKMDLVAVEKESMLPTLSQATLEKWANLISSAKRGVIIAASLPSCQNTEAILNFAKKLKWPILADVLSQVRSRGKEDEVIGYYDTLLKIDGDYQPDLILHLGDRLVSKTLQQWLTQAEDIPYLQITDHPWRQDPFHQVTHRLDCDPALLCSQIAPLIPNRTDASWINSWKEPSKNIETCLHFCFSSQTELSEPGMIHALNQLLKTNWSLFLGNSMPIRDADQFFFPEHPTGFIFGIRGVSGIDGNIATISGIAEGSKKPIVALIGDLTFLHDLNSLALLRSATVPILIIVVNNQGGGIFSFLPIAQKAAEFERLWGLEHSYSFEKAAELFGIPYSNPKNQTDLEDILFSVLKKPQLMIIETQTKRAQNVLFHEMLITQCLTLQASVT